MDTQWYTKAVNWGISAGVVLGMGDGTFGVNSPLTREQMVTFFYRYARYCGYGTSQTTDISWYAGYGSVSD